MYNRGKWSKYYDREDIQRIRDKIRDTYSNKLIFLEEPHEYYLDGVQYISVSEVTHKYKPISGEQMAINCVKKWQRDQDPTYKYYGMSKEEILAEWKIKSSHACEFGTEVHAFGESMFYFMVGEYENILPECKNKFVDGKPKPSNKFEEAVVQFWNDLPENFVPVMAEAKVFNKPVDGQGQAYAGTFDILFYYVDDNNPSNSGLVIFDYKTNEDLFKNFKGQTLLYPFNDMLDQNSSYYTLQLNCYQIPLENIGYKVVGRRLIWVKPDGTYEKVKIPSITDRVRKALNIRDAEHIMQKNIL